MRVSSSGSRLLNPYPPWSPVLSVLLVLAVLAAAQDKPTQTPPPQPPAPIVSPEVHTHGSITFRFRDRNAAEVKIGLGGADLVPMRKDDQTPEQASLGSRHGRWQGYASQRSPSHNHYERVLHFWIST